MDIQLFLMQLIQFNFQVEWAISNGQSEFVDTLATASTTVGIKGIFMETHV